MQRDVVAETLGEGVQQVLRRVGEKWSVLIIMKLKDGPLRFNELKRVVGGISQRMLFEHFSPSLKIECMCSLKCGLELLVESMQLREFRVS